MRIEGREYIRTDTVNRFGDDVILDIYRFSWDELGFVPVKKPKRTMVFTGVTRECLEKNTDRWGEWLVAVIKSATSPEDAEKVESGEFKYNATCIYMNEANNQHLHAHLFPMDWLNWSPVTQSTLADDEFGIEATRLMEATNGDE